MHIDRELVGAKIAILRGRGSENNRFILETLALKGPLIKYDVFKALKEKGGKARYSTISRRIDDLVNKGYLKPVGTRQITVGRRKDKTSTYGITGKGFIASLTTEAVAQDILGVFHNNTHLELPFPRKPALRIVEEMFTDAELKLIGQALLTGYLRAIPKDLESLKPEQQIMYLFPALTEAPSMSDTFKEKDWSRLLQIREVSELASDLLNKAEKGLEDSLFAIRELKKMLSLGGTLTVPYTRKHKDK